MTDGTLVILGSGEIAPSMVKVYRDVLSQLDDRHGVMLDTPFGFQENVPQLTTKIIDYFETSLQFQMTTASFTRLDEHSELDQARFLDTIRNSRFVFAGPGSPSYALKQWSPLAFTDALADVLAADGVVCSRPRRPSLSGRSPLRSTSCTRSVTIPTGSTDSIFSSASDFAAL